MVDKNGLLTIGPLNDSLGSFGSRDGYRGTLCPWSSFKGMITSVVFQGHVAIDKCMGDMFRDHRELRSIDFGSIDTSAVSSMNGLFVGCSSLTSIDLSSFDTSGVRSSMMGFFEDCSSLRKISLGKSAQFVDRDMRWLVNFPDNSKTGRRVSSVDGMAYENNGATLGIPATYTLQDPSVIKNNWNQ